MSLLPDRDHWNLRWCPPAAPQKLSTVAFHHQSNHQSWCLPRVPTWLSLEAFQNQWGLMCCSSSDEICHACGRAHHRIQARSMQVCRKTYDEKSSAASALNFFNEILFDFKLKNVFSYKVEEISRALSDKFENYGFHIINFACFFVRLRSCFSDWGESDQQHPQQQHQKQQKQQ